ncbi:MAG TPA: rhodanese-like domain-containing protein [Nitrosomonas sp.]|uniref:Putative transmembrane protein n=3 Tax=Nitrosomonadaceae TaxID=206379 RepID=Q82SU2_NITEU|nr:rhodanese-like domain-containing protein [Nitrosomonas sp. PRO5]QOJ08025.1 MAG: rhodanese-like domain-containing protein [Nitrosomonas sp. H1_AOB3]CAD86124.1 putative transmembrane protein [Nitrosomonas europaea ATCC 19718]HBF24029.1 rhodanese-like domain-containing protein [Nitrosomonas sp.]
MHHMESTFLVDNIFFIIAAMLSGGMLLWPVVARNSVRDIDPKRAIRLINYEDALVLDVRDDSEYAGGHPPNAKHIPAEKIEDRWQELEKFKDKPVVIIFTPGLRVGRAGAVLRKNGFKQVFNLNGGIDTWRRENLPLVKK